MKEQIFIYNRKNQKIAVLVDHAENSQGLVFVMHALSGFKEQPDSVTFAKAFSDHNYTVIRFDTTNSFGESDGNYEDATVTNYYEDLEDVIARAHDQDFYQEPFVLCGASLGGLCIILYAEQYPNKVKALAPVSTLISGQLSRDNYSPEKLQERERTGRRIEKRSNGDIKQLKRSHMIDRLRYDILPKTHLLTMPVLLVVGDQDTSAPVVHQQTLYHNLPGLKELHIIPDAPHTFRAQEHFDQLYQILSTWIQGLQR